LLVKDTLTVCEGGAGQPIGPESFGSSTPLNANFLGLASTGFLPVNSESTDQFGVVVQGQIPSTVNVSTQGDKTMIFQYKEPGRLVY
jgi:hypothetical protein